VSQGNNGDEDCNGSRSTGERVLELHLERRCPGTARVPVSDDLPTAATRVKSLSSRSVSCAVTGHIVEGEEHDAWDPGTSLTRAC